MGSSSKELREESPIVRSQAPLMLPAAPPSKLLTAGAIQAAKRRQPPYNRPRLILVESEHMPGRAEYAYLHSDGHLGAIED